MAEISYPVVNTSVSEAMWKVFARLYGNGIIDSGGAPYKVVSRTDATNVIVIGRDAVTGFAEGIVQGFVHRMDTDKSLTVPTAAATYEIGLVYDPAGHGTAAGPVKLDIWTAPGDYSNGKSRVVLYKIVRAASQALTAATLTSVKAWAAPVIRVDSENNLPRYQECIYGTEAVDMVSGRRWRNTGTGWSEMFTKDPEVANATGALTYGTLVKRSATDGGFLVEDATHPSHPVPLSQVQADFAAKSHTHSWSSITSKPTTFTPSSHNHNGDDITAGTVPYARINGSSHAYNNTNTGSTWSSIVAKSNGEFARYPSALKYKKGITDWKPEMSDVLAMNPVQYYGRQSGDYHIGIVADHHAGTSLDPLVQYGDPDGDGQKEVEGWHYFLMPVAQQVAILNHEERIVSLEREIAELRALIKGE